MKSIHLDRHSDSVFLRVGKRIIFLNDGINCEQSLTLLESGIELWEHATTGTGQTSSRRSVI